VEALTERVLRSASDIVCVERSVPSKGDRRIRSFSEKTNATLKHYYLVDRHVPFASQYVLLMNQATLTKNGADIVSLNRSLVTNVGELGQCTTFWRLLSFCVVIDDQ
jgi:hypothetical protein